MRSVMIRACAGIAQLVEHLIRNEGVAGSSPVSGTMNKKHWKMLYSYIRMFGMNTKTIIIIK